MTKRNSQSNLGVRLRRFNGLLIPTVLLLYLLLSGVIVTSVRQQVLADVSRMSRLYIDEMDNDLFRVSRRILLCTMDDYSEDSFFRRYVSILRNPGSSELSVNNTIQRLQEDMWQYTWEYGQEYHFFIYFNGQQGFHLLDLDGTSVQEQKAITVLRETLDNKETFTYSIKQKWEPFSANGESYIYKAAHRDGVYVGAFVNVRDLLSPFRKLVDGTDSYVQLTSGGDEIIGRIMDGNRFETTRAPHAAGEIRISQPMKRAPFSVEICLSGQKVAAILMSVLAAIVVLGMILLGSVVLSYDYLRRKVVGPVQRFAKQVMTYDKEAEGLGPIDSHQILELEQMDGQFRKMMNQIRKLKISLYEQELQKSEVEMDYLRLQVKPHFYLNCLNFIHIMLENGQLDSAKKMTALTSEYLRYIFGSGFKKVKIARELQQCENYLEVLKLRYETGLEYYVEINEEVENCTIFPFLIQNFVENSAKHGIIRDQENLISVTVYPEDREEGLYVNIYISDTGKGFPQEILDKLEKGEELADGEGHHIGIDNCLKRFRYLYGDRGEIHFLNSPLGGAVVDIHIPADETL